MQRDARGASRVRPREGERIDIQLMSDHFLDIFEARDISETGVGIYVPYRFQGCNLSNPVSLVVTLPGGRPFLAKGRVVHRSKVECEFFGVEFAGLSELQRRAIGRYVQDRLAECSQDEEGS